MDTRIEQAEPLPYGVGQFTPSWRILVAGLVAVTAGGAVAFSQEVREGLVVTGMRNTGPMGGATWGLYISFVVFFVGLSFAGITVAALIRLGRLEALRPIARIAELLTVVSLLLAALAILADLGKPLRGAVNLFRYARPQSPFFGTFTLVVAGYLFASVVYLYLGGRRDAAVLAERESGRLRTFHRLWAAGYRDTPNERRRHHRSSFWLAIAIVPLLVTAHSTLGFVFGLQVGRPGWYSALQAPAFVLLAGVSGVGAIIAVAAAVRRVTGERERLGDDVFGWLGGLFGLLVLGYLYFMLVELLTAGYTGQEHEQELTTELLGGRYAWIYWTSVASLVLAGLVPLVQAARRRVSIPLLVAAGLVVQVAAVGKRFLVVVPSQTHGTLLPYESGSYAPTLDEFFVVAGLIALGGLLYVVFARIFPIMEVAADREEFEQPERAAPSEGARRYVVVAMVAAGFALQAISYLGLAAPLGRSTTAGDSDPRLQFAPAFFILGVVLVFLAAVVYELLPERGHTDRDAPVS